MPSEDSEEILQTLAIIALHQHMQMIPTDSVLVNFDMKQARGLPHHTLDHFPMPEEAPPADGMM